MVEIEYEGEIFEVRNKLTEISIEEFEYINFILQKEDGLDLCYKYLDIFEMLGVSEKVIDNIDLDTFAEVVSKLEFHNLDFELKKEIEIDGIIYKLYDGEKFNPKMKELKESEDIVFDNPLHFAELLAYFYKISDKKLIVGNSKEHNDYKVEFFKKCKADILIPILVKLKGFYLQKLNIIIQ